MQKGFKHLQVFFFNKATKISQGDQSTFFYLHVLIMMIFNLRMNFLTDYLAEIKHIIYSFFV